MRHPPSASRHRYDGYDDRPEQDGALEDDRHVANFTISVVDSTHGRPAEGMAFRLMRKAAGNWQEQMHGHTDERGEFPNVLPPVRAASGVHRVELDLDGYFASLGMVAFHPTLTVDFRVVDPTQHHRISVMITPYSHMSYRSA